MEIDMSNLKTRKTLTLTLEGALARINRKMIEENGKGLTTKTAPSLIVDGRRQAESLKMTRQRAWVDAHGSKDPRDYSVKDAAGNEVILGELTKGIDGIQLHLARLSQRQASHETSGRRIIGEYRVCMEAMAELIPQKPA
jgi:hypothetical protein